MMTHLTLVGAEGVRLHAVAAGERGPVVLFLHGFPEFWQAWHRQLVEFSQDHRAVALDLRGYNLSDKPPERTQYELNRVVADIRHVLRTLCPDQGAVLVGHDWGGIAAWALARESPELVRRLVIINAPHPAIFYRELKGRWAQRWASSYAGFFQLPGVAEFSLQMLNYAFLRRMVFGMTRKPHMFGPELRAAYHAAWSQPRALKCGLNYYRNLGALKRMVATNSSWKINVPTLVLWGDQDPALVVSNLAGLDDFVPDLTVRRHAMGTHWVVHEEPEWVNGEIRAFIDQRPTVAP